jgi:chromosome segregation ATPase
MSDNSKLNTTPSSQNFACLSFFEGKDKDDKNLMYVRLGGVCDTYENACEMAKKINQEDSVHNVFVGEVGKWLPVVSNVSKSSSQYVEDVEYANEQLNELMKGYHANQEKAKLFYEHNKNEKMINNINDNLGEQEKNKKELTQKLTKAKSIDEVKTLTSSLENVDKQVKKLEERLKSLMDSQSDLQQKIGTDITAPVEK